MRARIFQPPKNAMQSGWGKTHQWVLEFVNTSPKRPDPLMGWIGGGDTDSEDQAEAAGAGCEQPGGTRHGEGGMRE